MNDQSVKEYKEPFMVDSEGTIKVMSILNGLQTDAIYYHYNISLASGKGILLKTKADPPYHRAGIWHGPMAYWEAKPDTPMMNGWAGTERILKVY